MQVSAVTSYWIAFTLLVERLALAAQVPSLAACMHLHLRPPSQRPSIFLRSFFISDVSIRLFRFGAMIGGVPMADSAALPSLQLLQPDVASALHTIHEVTKGANVSAYIKEIIRD